MAKLYFIALGLVQQIILPRVLGLAGYGALSSVLSTASIAYNPVITGSIQGVSRTVAEARDSERPAALRSALTVHLLVAVVLGAGFFLATPRIASWLGAPHLTGGLRLLSGVMFFYGVYAPLVGALNGLQRFVHQAALDILAATLRTAALVVGGWWALRAHGLGVEGASGGFTLATALVFLVALTLVGTGKAGPSTRGAVKYFGLLVPLVASQVLLNLLLQADLALLRKFAGEAALGAGLGAHAADPLVGAYRATQLFSFLPYQLLIAITFILFPMLATAHRDGDRQAVASYVRTGVRLALVLMGLLVSVTSGLASGLLNLVFGAEAAALGARSMTLLTLGFGAFAVFGIFITVLNSLGRERVSTLVTGAAALLVSALCFTLVRGTPFGPELLLRTAIATCVGLGLATALAAYFVWRTAGAVVAPLSLVRVLSSLAVAVLLARWLPGSGKLLTLAYSGVVAALYLTLLIVTRELSAKDLANVKAVLARRQRR